MGFTRFLRLETYKLFEKRKLAILIAFSLLAIFFIQSGISQYKDTPKEIKHFQEFEKERVENFRYYLQYGTYGFRLLYVPGPLSALFSNAGIIKSNLNAFIDSGERMKIYEPFKGKNAFIGYTNIFLNLSGLIFLLGSLLSLLYGFEAFRDRDFLKLQDGTGNRKNLFWFILVSRLLLLLGCCLVLITTIWLLYLLNGLTVNLGHVIIYGLAVFLMSAFFMLGGVFAGALKSRWVGIAVVISVWLVFIFGLPAIVGKIVSNRAEFIISTYEMDMNKFKLMMDIENKALEQAGKINIKNTNVEIRQKLHEYFWNNEFKQIFDHEHTMINEMKGVVSLHYNLSLIFPTSFFLSVNNEISGRGYENLMTFYDYALKHKKGFIRYYAEKSFYTGEKEVKAYLKGNKNVFRASSTLPGNFGFGVVITCFWLLLLLFLSWLAFNRMLNALPDTDSDTEPKYLKPDEFKKSKITAVVTFTPVLLANFLETLKKQGIRFVFAPGPDIMPGDVSVKSLFAFFGVPVPDRLQPVTGEQVGSLAPDHQALVTFELARSFTGAEFFIFNDFLAGLSDKFAEYFAGILDTLKKGRKIVYFTNAVPKVGDNVIRRANERQPF